MILTSLYLELRSIYYQFYCAFHDFSLWFRGPSRYILIFSVSYKTTLFIYRTVAALFIHLFIFNFILSYLVDFLDQIFNLSNLNHSPIFELIFNNNLWNHASDTWNWIKSNVKVRPLISR